MASEVSCIFVFIHVREVIEAANKLLRNNLRKAFLNSGILGFNISAFKNKLETLT